MITINLLPVDALYVKRRAATVKAAKWRAANPDKSRAATAKWSAANKEHKLAYAREYARSTYERHPDRVKAYSRSSTLHRKFGATQRDIDAQIAKQNGCCAICNDALRGGRFQHIDHDHTKPGTFRGVLCSQCNTAIGRFKDDPAVLARAAMYLRNGGAR